MMYLMISTVTTLKNIFFKKQQHREPAAMPAEVIYLHIDAFRYK